MTKLLFFVASAALAQTTVSFSTGQADDAHGNVHETNQCGAVPSSCPAGTCFQQGNTVITATRSRAPSTLTCDTSQTFLGWDTSSLPDNATVTAASLTIRVGNRFGTAGCTTYFDWFNGVINSTNWSNTATGTAKSLTQAQLMALTSGANNTIDLVNVGNVSKTARTGVRISVLSCTPGDGQSTGLDMTASESSGGVFAPKLNVTYTLPAPPPGKTKVIVVQ